jgi:hypothetical protein
MADAKKPRALEEVTAQGDARLSAPSNARNTGPIFDALHDELASRKSVLEIASGTGEHAVHFCTSLPHLKWQPSDIDEACLKSIAAWRETSALENLDVPVSLDVTARNWWEAIDREIDFILTCNLLHISPWEVTQGLMRGAGALLPAGGAIAVYGAFSRGGVHTAPSNEAFDASLKSRDPAWGVRDRDDVARVANTAGLTLAREIEMPANNLILLFERAGS